ncbi:ATP cone domain-containing protein, partial [Romboutsia sp.]|uniref:ATP cone domain-containing protein n=1 Tax=Romboutsia sp. TaxID=1965302 RepID=UPI002BFFA157
MKVIKRDGSVVAFDCVKIERAIKLSAERVRKKLSKEFCDTVVANTIIDIHKRNLKEIVTVDEIHLSV